MYGEKGSTAPPEEVSSWSPFFALVEGTGGEEKMEGILSKRGLYELLNPRRTGIGQVTTYLTNAHGNPLEVLQLTALSFCFYSIWCDHSHILATLRQARSNTTYSYHSLHR